MTIEQLAAETSMTVRNIRNHQSRGLIAGPVVRGRVGYYDDSHAERLKLIRRLQHDGLALKAIEGLLMPERSKLDAFREVILQPVATVGPEPERLARAELTAEFGEVDDVLLGRIVDHGVLREVEDGVFEILDPALFRAAQDSVRAGLSLRRALEASEAGAAAAAAAATTYVSPAVEAIWQPFVDRGQPEAELATITDALLRLEHVTLEAFAALFKRAMADEIQRVLSATGAGPEAR